MSLTASVSARRRPRGALVAGVAGSPAQVARSLSPAIHNAAFAALEMDWVYLTFGIAEQVPRTIRALGAAGVRGMNVTMPHKVAAVEAMDELSDAARLIGAVNTVEVKAGLMIGHNTDGEGLVRFLSQDAGVSIEGSPVVVIGAGGSARAAVHALAGAGAASIMVLARDPQAASALAPLASGGDFSTGPLPREAAGPLPEGAIIINATPIGQMPGASPLAADAIGPGCVVVDLVYEPAVTPLVEAARARGAIAHSGLGMLLQQASVSFEIWTGVQPPIDAMSAAALGGITRS